MLHHRKKRSPVQYHHYGEGRKHPQHTAEAQAIQECDASKTLVDRFHRRDQTLNHTHVRH